MTRFCIVFIFFLTLPLILYPQSHDLIFDHLSVDDGLSNSVALCILQDSKGFIWIGTKYGLNRYDGYTIKVFTHDPGESKSISDNWIEIIYEDPADSGKVLWIGTKGGLNKLDLEKEQFTHYLHKPDDSTSLSHNEVTAICKDNKGFLWIGTWLGGLNRFNKETGEFTAFKNDSKNPFSLSDNRITSVYIDHDGNMWAGTKGCLNKLNLSDNSGSNKNSKYRFQRYYLDQIIIAGQLKEYINDIFEDNDRVLWIASEMGLFTFDRKTNQFNRLNLRFGKNEIKSIGWANSIVEDAEGELWIATIGQGLVNLNSKRDRLTIYQHNPNSSSNFIPASNNIAHAIVDHTGVIWIASFGYGANKLIPNRKRFQNFKHIPGDTTSLSRNKITSICEDGDSNLWVSAWGGGINKFEKDKKHFVQYPISARRICLAKSGELWLAQGETLRKFDPKNGKIINYIGSKTINSPLRGDHIATNFENIRLLYYVYEDIEGTVWCLMGPTSAGKTVFQFDENQRQFTPYKILSNEDLSNDVTRIYEDRSGGLWFGTSRNGIIQRIKNKTDSTKKKYKFNHYKNDRDDNHSISSNIINAFCEDKAGYLWIGTEAGLNKFDPVSKSFQHYRKKDGLSSDLIFGILEDDNGNLWLGTNRGISNFNPFNGTFKNFDKSDGLLSASYGNYGAYCKSDELLFFGSNDGLTAFSPEDLKYNLSTPKTVITDFKIFNKSVIPGANSLLKKSISLSDEIILEHDQDVFSLEFAALDFTNPSKNKYRYQMEDVDPEWVFADASRRFVSYTQLDPGEYVFRVKGSNNDGLWDEDGTSIKIIISPPWWKTNWAYSTYLILFALTLYALRTYDKKRQNLKHDLELEHLHAEKLGEVDRIKSRFFANISHEFRTPLTLIKSPVKQIMDGEFTGNLKQQCKMILRNSDRLLGLINQLLDLSKLESGRMTLQVAKTDLVKFIKGFVLSFSSLAESKKITLKFESEDDSIMGYIDRNKVEKIISNLLSNAFKFTPEYGEIGIHIGRGEAFPGKTLNNPETFERNALPQQSPIPNSDFLKIQITNTGPGIPQEQLDKIFDRFYQIDDSATRHQEGTGIGLALTKELVELHYGTINVECRNIEKHLPQSTLNRGELFRTSFTIFLPIGKGHYSEDEIVEEVETGIRRPETGKQIISGSTFEKNAGYQIPDTEEQSELLDRPTVSGLPPPLVLVVEDNPDVTTYIRSFLDQDYQIITAINGNMGWKKTIEKYPDLIISDVMMPEMDGFELCQKIKSNIQTSHIPVILLTAKAGMDNKIEGLQIGADDYISKPFEARELQARAKNLIEQRNTLREKFTRMIDINPAEIAATSTDEQFVKRLLDVFENHVAESDFSTEDFAREIGISRSNLHRKLQALTNQPTHEFLRSLRLKRAAQLLKKSAASVTEVAYAVGFNNPSHFSKIFREQFGQSPSEFANKNQ